MRNRRTPRSLLTTVGIFRDIMMLLVARLSLPWHLAPVPVPVRPRFASGTTRGTPPGRLPGWLPLVVAFVLLGAIPAWAGQPALPAGVPNIYDPEVRAHFQPVAVATLDDNPDFPVVLLVDTTEEQPQALLLGLDARNGKDTWSLTTDPIILLVVFSDEATVQGVYVDAGFATHGMASGHLAVVDEMSSPGLPDLLKAVTAAGARTYI